ncbi:hypothetical protein CU669_07910 [Paramagnetospirillum kuznetsovii]|uniref:Uncharacterized protein n=1 Tax=Paramagnetospirillum kuznetsovii TaxID=2053833 RepID=A0A364P0A5_9PROT|nr:hypothetical protein CU669_07910 [Paramagnetospirillum kuznetsovii]
MHRPMIIGRGFIQGKSAMRAFRIRQFSGQKFLQRFTDKAGWGRQDGIAFNGEICGDSSEHETRDHGNLRHSDGSASPPWGLSFVIE